jgi:hypothetical protein
VRHDLVAHPWLQLERIAELADRLPAGAVERHRADLPLIMPGGAPELDGPPSETVLGIQSNGAWMVLWNIEDDPRYRALLDQCLDQVERRISLARGDMRNRQAFLFLSAPNANTPVHFDPEHNLLLQIHGIKEMNVGRFLDPGLQASELARYYGGGHRNLESMPEDVSCFRMSPGDGTYVPPFAPHFVRNGPEPSISLSITFRTRASERFEYAHRFNAKLKSVPIPMGEPGRWSALDRVKALAVAASDRANDRTLGRREKNHA